MLRPTPTVLALLLAACGQPATTTGPAPTPASKDPPPAATVAGLLQNPSFEQGGADDPHPHWTVPRADKGFTGVRITDPADGAAAACVTAPSQGAASDLTWGSLRQKVPATGLQGRRVRLRAATRVASLQPLGSNGQLELHAFSSAQKSPLTGVMADVAHVQWTPTTLVLDVPRDAEWLSVDATVHDGWPQTICIDAAELVNIGAVGEGDEPARPLAERGRDNLAAFARLYGVVRFFHASDAAAGADWEGLAIAGVQAVEPAATPEALAQALQRVFGPIAPGLQVVAGPPPAPAPLAAPAGATRALAWRHVGFRLDPAAPPGKSSERVELTSLASDGQPLPDPRTPHVADLGAGVSCVVPLAVWADAEGTLPRATGQALAPDKPAAFAPSGDDRATRLAAIVAAWAVPQQFFPYFAEVGVDWDAVLRDTLTRAAEDRDRHAFARTLRRMAAALQDGHAYVDAPTPDPALAANLPLLLVHAEGQVAVKAVGAGAGDVRPGDVVLEIDGVPAGERLTELMAEVPGAHEDARRARALQRFVYGPEGGSAALKLRRPAGEVVAATVAYGHEPPPEWPRRGPLEDLEPGILLIDAGRASAMQLYAAGLRISAARGILIDGRYGLDDGTTDTISNLLVRNTGPIQALRTPITLLPGRQHVRWQEQSWELTEATGIASAPVVVLIDPRVISAPEMQLMLLEHHRRATFVGVRSGGTEGEMSRWKLPGGYTLAITSDRVTKHGGGRHHGVGVAADVVVTPTIAGLVAGRDEVFDRGLEVLKQKLAAR